MFDLMFGDSSDPRGRQIQPPAPSLLQQANQAPVQPNAQAQPQQAQGPQMPFSVIDQVKSQLNQPPTSLSQVPNPTREQFTSTPEGNLAQKIGGWTLGAAGAAVVPSPKLDTAGYLNAKIDRIGQIALLAGATPDELKGIREQAKYALSQVPKTGKQEEDVAAAEQKLSELEAQYAPVAIEKTTGSPTIASTTPQDIPGTYTPQEQAAIQVAIGQYMKPYADQATLNGQNAANILNSTASSIKDPAYRAIVQQQAALAQSGGANMANAYMQQAAVLPAINALEAQRQQAAQISSLQNQLLAQQSQQSSGTGDINSILASLGQTGS